MGYLKAIIVFALVALSIVFMIQNITALSHPLQLRLNLIFYNFESSPFATYLIILLAFFMGLLSASVLGIVERFRLRNQLRQKDKSLKDLRNELNSLRNLPITQEGMGAGALAVIEDDNREDGTQ